MDLSDYIKFGLPSYHKQQGMNFGRCLNTKVKSERFKEERKNTRDKFISKKRLINGPLSPYKTPKASTKTEREVPKIDAQMKKRFELLQQWKAEKERKLKEQKAKAKPLFKVTHVSEKIGVGDLQSVNKTIKGKPIKSSNKKKSPLSTRYEFAPKNYQFKPPDNIKPIQIKNNPKKKLVRQQNICEETLVSYKNSVDKNAKKVTMTSDNNEKTPKKHHKIYRKTPAKIKTVDSANTKINENKRYDLRNRKLVAPVESKQPSKVTKTKKIEEKMVNSQTKPKRKESKVRKLPEKVPTDVNSVLREKAEDNHSTSDLSTEYPLQECQNSSQSDSDSNKVENHKTDIHTPNSKNDPVVYISPFVTISRGKNSARKEFHSRKSKGGVCDSSPDVEISTGPKAGAAYFHRLLDSEITRIQGLCDEWNLYKDEQNPPEEACDMINVATGQSQLLIDKKFKQFRNLIYSCENGDSEMPITCEDLHGFWDTAYIQVENLNRRFENLVLLRSNNWEEIIPEKTKAPTKKAVKPKPKAQASSRLKDAIRAARNKAKTAETEEKPINTFEGGFFSIQSPEKSPKQTPKSQNRRSSKKRSLLVDVLTNETNRRESSPGLIMWKTSQVAKSFEKENVNTPGRSILKSGKKKSNVRNAKSVLFEDEEKTPNVPVAKLISLTPEDENSRMSLRRRLKTKLF